MGLPVPPGFTISTGVCTAYYENGRSFPDTLGDQVARAVEKVAGDMEAGFGDPANPLLLSVRSGARTSMPGMMDTVLNLGLNDETVEGLAKLSGDPRFAYDSYRRFIQMYSDVVLGVDHDGFEEILDEHKDLNGLTLDTDLEADDWKAVVARYKERVAEEHDDPFPETVEDQLWGAIGAVFGSWQNARAKTYRRLHAIPDEWGTAVNVQAMVFGNMGESSATGVAFTRNPSTGAKEFFGEYLVNAQGEDVVAGIRTPQNITENARRKSGTEAPSLEGLMPDAFAELMDINHKLEAHYRDMQDIEFTIQDKRLWMLQTRAGKRTTKAALKIAVDMAEEGLISHEDAVARIDPAGLEQLLHPTIDPAAHRKIIATGLPASPGAAFGEVMFSPHDAEPRPAAGVSVILVRGETSPEDIHGMPAASAIPTARGRMTTHAPLLARALSSPSAPPAALHRTDR